MCQDVLRVVGALSWFKAWCLGLGLHRVSFSGNFLACKVMEAPRSPNSSGAVQTKAVAGTFWILHNPSFDPGMQTQVSFCERLFKAQNP